MYPDLRSPDTYPTKLRIKRDGNQLVQHLTFGQGTIPREISSTGRIDGSRLYFEGGSQTNQVLLLPDGASSTCPQLLKVRQGFFLEVGWLLQPDLRQRLIRRYDDKGAWSSLTLVTEHRVNSSL